MGRARPSRGLRTTALLGAPSGQALCPPSPDCLIALDLLCWLGSGRQVAARLGCNPSTISRKAETCAVSLGLLLRKRAGLWILHGDGAFLQAERELQQRYRFAGSAPLRLEVCAELADALSPNPHLGWSSGGQGHLSSRRPLELLQQRVIDAWLCSFCEELPCEMDPFWQVLDLASLPLLLLADARHPLATAPAHGAPESASLRDWPCLGLPEQGQSRRRALLRSLGLAHAPQPLERYDVSKWDEPLNDGCTLRPGLAFDLQRNPGWRALPIPLAHDARLGLVVCRELVDQPPIQALHGALQGWINNALS